MNQSLVLKRNCVPHDCGVGSHWAHCNHGATAVPRCVVRKTNNARVTAAVCFPTQSRSSCLMSTSTFLLLRRGRRRVVVLVQMLRHRAQGHVAQECKRLETGHHIHGLVVCATPRSQHPVVSCAVPSKVIDSQNVHTNGVGSTVSGGACHTATHSHTATGRSMERASTTKHQGQPNQRTSSMSRLMLTVLCSTNKGSSSFEAPNAASKLSSDTLVDKSSMASTMDCSRSEEAMRGPMKLHIPWHRVSRRIRRHQDTHT